MAADPWRSSRLIYAACEVEDEPFLSSIQADALSWLNAAPFLAVPQSKAGATGTREYFRDKCMLAVKICLPAPASAPPGDGTIGKPIPIGTIALTGADPRMIHHRNSMIGINILRAYHGQGYGSEAIRWALRWGFRHGNLHKIELGAFGWNQGALRLYERLGFVRESCKRDHLWYDGRYWDLIELSMLEGEWKEKYDGDEKDVVVGAEKSD